MKKQILIACATVAFCFSQQVSASTRQENADLALVVRQLQAVYPLIYKAQLQANPNARQQFQYSLLRSDLATIVSGINQKLKPQPLEPRKVKPIKGDYIRLRSANL